MRYYWDSSALLALIFEEPRTAAMRHLASRKAGLPGYTTFFSLIEMESAYARRMAEGSLKAGDLPRLRLTAQRLEAALGILWADEEIMKDARHLILEQGLRPGDAIQLASARLLARDGEETTFVCLDAKLSQAAQAVGLAVAA